LLCTFRFLSWLTSTRNTKALVLSHSTLHVFLNCHDQPIETWLDKISTVPFHTFLLLHYKRKAFWLVDIFFNKFSYQSLSDVRGGSWLVDIVLISFLISLCQCEGVFLIGWYSFNKFSYQFLSDVRGCSWLVDSKMLSPS
jgi:hypothetical protein